MKRRLVIFYLLFFVFLVQTEAQKPECASAFQKINADSLKLRLEELVGRKQVFINGIPKFIQSRYAYHSDNALAASYIEDKCLSYGYSIRTFEFGSSGKNVIAEKRGTQFPNQSIMLCAHYDCVGGKFTPSQGADDNASGVAALLEAARVLKDINFPYTIQLAFWDEEELGLLGSKAFPASGGGLPEPITVINLDMIAWDGNKDSLAMLHVTPSLPKSLEFADRMHYLIGKYKLPLKVIVKNPGEPNTDHQTFWDRGIPAVGLTEDYDNDFNPHWHLYSDSIENIHQNYFLNMSKLAIIALCEFSHEGITGIENKGNVSELTAYPNPAIDMITLTGKDLHDIEVVKLQSLTGQAVFLPFYSFSNTLEIILPNNLPPSIYFISIFGSNQTFLPVKFIVE
jgi:hypothetical protein